ncbi:MAG: isopentenyl phosphate kinase family protein [Thaumarchaeota archaeon]|nr:isopentenyl phosphate kinase family protein [Candidatus Wolframiiraptor allenii]
MVKLGGSLITDKSRRFSLNADVVKRLGRELAEAVKESGVNLIVVHGGGSYAHPVAKEYSVSEGLRGKGGLRGFVETSRVVRMLCLDVLSNLIDGGLMAVSIPASSVFTTRSGRISTCNLEPVFSALRLGLVPITSGDVVFDRDLGFTVLSGDEISSYLAVRLRARRLIYAMNVDGIYVRDWATGGIKIAEEFSRGMNIASVGGGVEDVTGGIARKIEEGFTAAEAGIEVLFINGLAENRLRDAVLGLPVPGTRLKP